MITVVVEVPPESPPVLARAAIEGCDGALGKGRCLLAGSAPAPDGSFYARVSVDDREPSVVSVELRERGRSGRLLELRELRFSQRDTELERSTSVGVVIAALVAAQRRDEPEPQPRPPVQVPAGPERRKPLAEAPPRRTFELRADLGATLSRGLDEDRVQLGGALRLSGVLEPWPMFGIASGGYGTRSKDQPDVSWWYAALGAGVRLGSSAAPLSAELRTEAVAERVSVQAVDPDSGRSAAAERWRFGPRVGLDGVWSFSERLGVVAGAQAAVLRPAVVIDLNGSTVEEVTAFSWGTFWGIRFVPR